MASLRDLILEIFQDLADSELTQHLEEHIRERLKKVNSELQAMSRESDESIEQPAAAAVRRLRQKQSGQQEAEPFFLPSTPERANTKTESASRYQTTDQTPRQIEPAVALVAENASDHD